MKSTRIRFFALFTWVMICAVSPTIIAIAQDNQNQKSGSTADAWRQSLPPEAEAQSQPEDMTVVAPSSPSDDETKMTLLSLERMWMDSLRAGDADTLSQIVSGDFTFASPLVLDVSDRTKYLEYALRELKLTSYEFDKTTVRLFGRTAIVSVLLKQRATVRGKNWVGSYLITDVWISRGGNWRAVSRHESLLQ
ncbi:MAG: nuclear transport factor 2 family protein [Pyrinomonadaceae bacterium]|nr:nuclear transport factor 2 family protein [Pyrinomonadaceae bacterium]